VASKCYRLDDDQQKKWDAIQALSKEEITRAEKTFIQDIMGKQQTFFNRVDIGKYLKYYDKNILTNKVASNTKEAPIPKESIGDTDEDRVGDVNDGMSLTPTSFIAYDPLAKTRRPRLQDWAEEQADSLKSSNDPKISKFIKIPDKIKTLNEVAKNTLDSLQEEYNTAKESGNEDKIKQVEKNIKGLAKESGLSKKALLGKSWDNLTKDQQLALSIQSLEDRSLHLNQLYEFFDVEYFAQFMEELTGLPFYSLQRRMAMANASAETIKELVGQKITTDPNFKKARTDEKALERVSQELNSRNKAQGIESPTDLTDEELLLADAIAGTYKMYEPHVRYLRFMRTKDNIKELKKEFPDAVEAGKEGELALALEIRHKGNLDDLWNYLYDLDWGVIGSGFDPRLISDPTLKISKSHGLRGARGEGRLLRREQIEFPSGKMSKNVLARLLSYVEQMEIQIKIEPELDTLAGYWDMVGTKFENYEIVKKGLENWIQKSQNMATGFNSADRLVRRIWRQAMASIFMSVGMAVRNFPQAISLHPDRTELFKVAVANKVPAPLREKSDIYYRTHVAELGGIRRDYLHVGERGFLIPEWWNRLADSVSLYGISDNLPRLWSFKASLNKASIATEQFKQDGDVAKWLKNSGAIHLRDTERNFVLIQYLGQLDKNIDLAVPGIRKLTGSDMASLYLAQRLADITNFKYRRSERAIMEMGVTGSTLWNLIVFPRGYAQRLYFQAEKIKNVFKKEATWAEASSGFKDIIGIVITSQIVGALLSGLTGKKKNPYDPFNVLFGWTFGGLFVGIASDLTKLIGDVGTVINPMNDDKEGKALAWAKIPQEVTRMGSSVVPFYSQILNVLEAMTDRKNVDIEAIRKLRALIDDNYTPQEQDNLNMDLWEKIRKAVLGGDPIAPEFLEKAMQNIDDNELKLGTRDAIGGYYTLGKLAGSISSGLRDIPDALITEQEGFSPLVLFYKECEAQWAELFILPSSDRAQWRLDHPYEEAMLLFWEKYDKSVFTKGSKEGEEITNLLSTWFDVYNIDEYKHGHWTNFTLPTIPLTNEN
jgi:hypothetical protein